MQIETGQAKAELAGKVAALSEKDAQAMLERLLRESGDAITSSQN